MLESRVLICAVRFAGLLGHDGSNNGEAVLQHEKQVSPSGSEFNFEDFADEIKSSGATMADVMEASPGQPKLPVIETGHTATVGRVQIQEVRRFCGINS